MLTFLIVRFSHEPFHDVRANVIPVAPLLLSDLFGIIFVSLFNSVYQMSVFPQNSINFLNFAFGICWHRLTGKCLFLSILLITFQSVQVALSLTFVNAQTFPVTEFLKKIIMLTSFLIKTIIVIKNNDWKLEKLRLKNPTIPEEQMVYTITRFPCGGSYWASEKLLQHNT